MHKMNFLRYFQLYYSWIQFKKTSTLTLNFKTSQELFYKQTKHQHFTLHTYVLLIIFYYKRLTRQRYLKRIASSTAGYKRQGKSEIPNGMQMLVLTENIKSGVYARLAAVRPGLN